MNKSIKVSVVIPARNRPEFTSEAVQSVIDQLLPQNVDLEIIVIDNRSKPPLKKLIGKKFPQAKFIRSRGYDSPGGTRNYGLKQASGDYIAFIDNDDKWHPQFLNKSLQAIKKYRTPATVTLTNPYFFGDYPTTEVIKLIFLNLVRASVFFLIWLFNRHRLPHTGFYLCQISHMLFDTRAVKKTTFNQVAVAAEDWEFFADVIKSKPIAIILNPLVNFRYSWSSNTNTDAVREKKWNAYQDLIKKLPKSYKKGILHRLFNLYIGSFGSS